MNRLNKALTIVVSVFLAIAIIYVFAVGEVVESTGVSFIAADGAGGLYKSTTTDHGWPTPFLKVIRNSREADAVCRWHYQSLFIDSLVVALLITVVLWLAISRFRHQTGFFQFSLIEGGLALTLFAASLAYYANCNATGAYEREGTIALRSQGHVVDKSAYLGPLWLRRVYGFLRSDTFWAVGSVKLVGAVGDSDLADAADILKTFRYLKTVRIMDGHCNLSLCQTLARCANLETVYVDRCDISSDDAREVKLSCKFQLVINAE